MPRLTHKSKAPNRLATHSLHRISLDSGSLVLALDKAVRPTRGMLGGHVSGEQSVLTLVASPYRVEAVLPVEVAARFCESGLLHWEPIEAHRRQVGRGAGCARPSWLRDPECGW